MPARHPEELSYISKMLFCSAEYRNLMYLQLQSVKDKHTLNAINL